MDPYCSPGLSWFTEWESPCGAWTRSLWKGPCIMAKSISWDSSSKLFPEKKSYSPEWLCQEKREIIRISRVIWYWLWILKIPWEHKMTLGPRSQWGYGSQGINSLSSLSLPVPILQEPRGLRLLMCNRSTHTVNLMESPHICSLKTERQRL